MKQEVSKYWNILLVEDNPGDSYLLQECFDLTGAQVNLIVAKDGRQACDILFPPNKKKLVELDMVLLDLNLPVVNGKELLRRIRSCPALESMPVAILSSSGNQDDIRYCRQLGVFSYYIKPDEIEELMLIVKNIEDYLVDEKCRKP